MVALYGYVPTPRQGRLRFRGRDKPDAAEYRAHREFRERRRNQGGEQVVHDLNRSSIFREPCSPQSEQGSSFPGNATTSLTPGSAQQTFNPKTLIEHHI